MEKNGFPHPGELREAASKGDVEEVRALLRAGADCDDNLADEDESTALMWASGTPTSHRDVVELLVGAGADVNLADEDGTTALIEASVKGHRDVVEALLGAGADVNATSYCGFTPGGWSSLWTALMYAGNQDEDDSHRDVVELLVGAGGLEYYDDGDGLLIMDGDDGYRKIGSSLDPGLAKYRAANQDKMKECREKHRENYKLLKANKPMNNNQNHA